RRVEGACVRIEARCAPRQLRHAAHDLGGRAVEGDDAGGAAGDRAVDAVARLLGRRGARAARDRVDHTLTCATPGRTSTASRAESMNDSACGRTIAAERTRWCAGSTPGGVTPSSRSASTAFRSFWRALMIPVSED